MTHINYVPFFKATKGNCSKDTTNFRPIFIFSFKIHYKGDRIVDTTQMRDISIFKINKGELEKRNFHFMRLYRMSVRQCSILRRILHDIVF